MRYKNSMMEKHFILVCYMVISILSLFQVNHYAQNLFNNPESAVFDASRNRYIVSNWGDGSIVQIDSNGNQSYFSTELQYVYKVAGLYIYNDTLLAASGDTLKSDSTGTGLTGFIIDTGEIIFHIPIPGIGLPNDITSDKEGIIYLTDYWGNRLYKIENRKPSVFIRQNLNYPNGILYDNEQNRLLILSVGGVNAPILAVNLPDTTLYVVIETGFVQGLDGIDMDNEGRIYVSEWGGDAVYRIDKNIKGRPSLFSKEHNDPADIYIDKTNNILVVPNFSSNTVDFIPINNN
ncbi:SMP-30/gluconolactonase/LRE family protein [Bacteroidota bacterium]